MDLQDVQDAQLDKLGKQVKEKLRFLLEIEILWESKEKEILIPVSAELGHRKITTEKIKFAVAGA